MAYQNINFPTLKLKHDFRESQEAPTTIVSNFAKEYRINRFSTAKRTFTFPARNMKYADWQTIATFMDTVDWSKDSFNLIHPFTAASIKVRFGSYPSYRVVALNSSNQPTIVEVSDITLIEVFNE